jgi:hypothetical protein
MGIWVYHQREAVSAHHFYHKEQQGEYNDSLKDLEHETSCIHAKTPQYMFEKIDN